MTYDINGIGASELVYIAVNFPTTYDEIQQQTDEIKTLELARKFIEAVNAGLIEGGK